MAFVMAATIVAGFSLQLAMGRSSFGAPPLVHAHALVFMGWMVLYVLQNIFITRGSMALHRTLGWIGAGWMVLMVVLGCAVTVAMVRAGHVPFFFRPVQFLVFDPVTVFTFAGLTIAAIVMRRRTEWHRRLHYCGMAMLLDPALGRLLPVPLLVPWAWEATFAVVMIFPIIGVVADYRRAGVVHPAWGRGIAVMIAAFIVTEAVTYSPVGTALYNSVTAGSPGADVPPFDFPPPPTGPLVTGR
ncbi:MAG: hypothetical protein J0J06_07475 [Sphingomonas sp.]|nr:hypothetical protein [Sphingomonas sp.]